jgi:hypothetical protein
MPTPFTHLEVAQRLLCDEAFPIEMRDVLNAERGAFLLGSIAADARVDSGMRRESTHFYAYDRPINQHPWRVMVEQYPLLLTPGSPAQRAFLAGYVAHLAIDESWGKEVLHPRFVQHDWGVPREQRFLMLHIILIYMDERDLAHLDGWQADSLPRAQPDHWLPFMSDPVLSSWRDSISAQIAPDGRSLTLELLGARIHKTPQELRAILDSPEIMQANLWDHVPLDFLHKAELNMYAFARRQLSEYWAESGHNGA